MPIYEYRCATCGYQKEYLQKVSDPKLTDCPECGKPTFDKMLSAAGFQLKGSGWYVTDFRNNGAKPKDGAKSKDGEKSQSADSTKTESTETKKEDKKPDSAASATPAST